MKVAVVVNEAAGKGLSRTKGVREIVESIGRRLPDATVKIARRGDEIEEIAAALAREHDVIVAVGGDGTISSVAQAIVGTEATLGIVQAGTFNHFARDIGIPLDVDDAIDVILAGKTRDIDVGDVNGRVFINNSSHGVYTAFASYRHALRAAGQRWVALLRAAIAAVRRAPLLDVDIHVGGAHMRRRTALVFVGNNEYRAQRRGIGGRDRLDGGELCLFVAHDTGSHGLLRLAARAVLRGLKHAFDDARAEEIRVHDVNAKGNVSVAVDGEVVSMRPPLHYRIRKRALRVLVP